MRLTRPCILFPTRVERQHRKYGLEDLLDVGHTGKREKALLTLHNVPLLNETLFEQKRKTILLLDLA